MLCISHYFITSFTIIGKPQYETKLAKKEDTLLGQSPSFICRFVANPQSTIQWYKNNRLVTDIQYNTIILSTNASLTLSSSTLTFLNTGINDKANYTCTAKNTIGEASQTKYLNVLCK